MSISCLTPIRTARFEVGTCHRAREMQQALCKPSLPLLGLTSQAPSAWAGKLPHTCQGSPASLCAHSSPEPLYCAFVVPPWGFPAQGGCENGTRSLDGYFREGIHFVSAPTVQGPAETRRLELVIPLLKTCCRIHLYTQK